MTDAPPERETRRPGIPNYFCMATYYRRKDVPAGADNEYISRLRLNAVVTF